MGDSGFVEVNMTDMYLDEIVEQIKQLNEDNQRKVLEYARSLSRPKGISGKAFLEHTRDIRISSDDLKLMTDAIEEAFEVIEDFPKVSFDE
jgi:hypothetical protein